VTRWERKLDSWVAEGLLDAAAAARIRDFESAKGEGGGLHGPVRIAVGLGALLLAASVLLFVAAHWDGIGPGARFLLVLSMVGGFHACAALVHDRFPVLATSLHAVGTASLGAGIALAGQIFNLEEHWPGAILLWALGAGLGWTILRDTPQAFFFAILAPAWLASEWQLASAGSAHGSAILTEGLLVLALTYFGADGGAAGATRPVRRALEWLGAGAVIPLAFVVAIFGEGRAAGFAAPHELSATTEALGWALAYGLPLVLAFVLRRKAAIWNLFAAAWVYALGRVSSLQVHAWLGGLDGRPAQGADGKALLLYGLCALGAIYLIAWGMRETSVRRVNAGVTAFAATVVAFYFSNVMDRLDRSASLLGMGLLFLLGGWLIERARRRLLARMGAGS